MKGKRHLQLIEDLTTMKLPHRLTESTAALLHYNKLSDLVVAIRSVIKKGYPYKLEKTGQRNTAKYTLFGI